MIRLYKLYLKDYKKEVILGPLFKLLEAVFELLVPLIMGLIVDKGINEGNHTFIIQMGIVLFVIAVLGLSSTLVCQYFASKASQGFGTKLREDVFKHILDLDILTVEKYGVSTLVTRLNNDINQLQVSVAMLIRLAIRAPFLVIGATVLSAFKSYIFGLIFLGASILVIGSVLLIMKKTIPLNRKVSKDLDSVTLITKENIKGSRVVRASLTLDVENNRFQKETAILNKDAKRVGLISAFLNPISMIIIDVVILLIIYLGGYFVDNGSLSQGDITALVNYSNQILVAIMVLCNLIVIFGKAFASGNRVNEILDTKKSFNYGTLEEGINDTVYELTNVNFSYPNMIKNFLNCDKLTIKKGEFIGIVGSTASGKTTLLNVLAHLYKESSGTLLLYGNDINTYSKAFLNKKIAYVFGKANLINDSIYNNVRFGSNASKEEVIKALKDALAYDFVFNKKSGLDDMIYEGGANLSGGERQRLCIARAICKKPDIIILDDATSALDFKTDYEVRKNLKALNITTILATSRISSIQECDQILVMDNGNVSDIGTDLELSKRSKIYQEIKKSQQGDNYE